MTREESEQRFEKMLERMEASIQRGVVTTIIGVTVIMGGLLALFTFAAG